MERYGPRSLARLAIARQSKRRDVSGISPCDDTRTGGGTRACLSQVIC